MQIHELPTISGSPSGGYFATDNGTQTTKIDYTALAQAIIEQYNASTLAGSAQSVKAALDGIKTGLDVVYGANPIKTLAASDDLLSLDVGHYRINNAVPLNAPDSNLKYGFVTIQKRGASGYTYYEYVVGDGNGNAVIVYHGWKYSNSATKIAWTRSSAMQTTGLTTSITDYVDSLPNGAVTYMWNTGSVGSTVGSPFGTEFPTYYEIIKINSSTAYIKARAMARAVGDMGVEYVRQKYGSGWSDTWEKLPTRAEVDALSNNLGDMRSLNVSLTADTDGIAKLSKGVAAAINGVNSNISAGATVVARIGINSTTAFGILVKASNTTWFGMLTETAIAKIAKLRWSSVTPNDCTAWTEIE